MRCLDALLLILLFASPALAQDTGTPVEGKATATVQVQPIDPALKAARELDRLFADLRKSPAEKLPQIEQKIWSNLARNPSPTAELLLRQASLAMADGELSTSETMLNELIGTYPDYAEAINRRASLYYRQNKYDDALSDIDQVLDLEPRHFGALAARGMIYAAQKKWGAAEASLTEALAINPNSELVKAALKSLQHDQPGI